MVLKADRPTISPFENGPSTRGICQRRRMVMIKAIMHAKITRTGITMAAMIPPLSVLININERGQIEYMSSCY